MNGLRWLTSFPALVLIAGARLYQRTLSHIVGQQCRFHPTCSEYFILAVRKYGAVRGSWKGVCRIGRCHPWNPGGIDWP
jgi:hypothetical protein